MVAQEKFRRRDTPYTRTDSTDYRHCAWSPLYRHGEINSSREEIQEDNFRVCAKCWSDRGKNPPTFSTIHVVHSVSLLRRPSSDSLLMVASFVDASLARCPGSVTTCESGCAWGRFVRLPYYRCGKTSTRFFGTCWDIPAKFHEAKDSL